MGKRNDQAKLVGYLLRDIPREVMDKIRAAAAIHNSSTKTYIRELFAAHINELERKGMTLSVPKSEERKRNIRITD